MTEQHQSPDLLCSDSKLGGLARRIADSLLVDGATEAACQTLVDDLTVLAEKAVVARKKAQPPSVPIACRQGCDSCCYMRVVVTVPEIVSIIAYLAATFDSNDLAALRERMAAVARAGSKMSDEERGVRGVPCPFLVEGNCSIYAARPLECRGYNSINVEACIAAWENYLGWEVPVYMPEFIAYKQIQAGILQALDNSGLSTSIVELSAAVEAVISRSETLEEWLSGAPAFETAELDQYDAERRAFLPWTPSDELRGVEPEG